MHAYNNNVCCSLLFCSSLHPTLLEYCFFQVSMFNKSQKDDFWKFDLRNLLCRLLKWCISSDLLTLNLKRRLCKWKWLLCFKTEIYWPFLTCLQQKLRQKFSTCLSRLSYISEMLSYERSAYFRIKKGTSLCCLNAKSIGHTTKPSYVIQINSAQNTILNLLLQENKMKKHLSLLS